MIEHEKKSDQTIDKVSQAYLFDLIVSTLEREMEMISFISKGHELPLIHAEYVFRIMHNTYRFPFTHTRVADFLRPRTVSVYKISKLDKCKILIVDSLTLVGRQGRRDYSEWIGFLRSTVSKESMLFRRNMSMCYTLYLS